MRTGHILDRQKRRAIVRNGTWRPGIGNPTIGGWITVLLYCAAFLTTWRAAQFTDGREQKLWLLVALMFILLGINKHALTEAGRIVVPSARFVGRDAPILGNSSVGSNFGDRDVSSLRPVYRPSKMPRARSTS